MNGDLSKTDMGSLTTEAPNAGGPAKIGDFRQITYNSKTSIVTRAVNLVRSQVYYTFVCSTFTMIQRVARVRQRQLILVLCARCASGHSTSSVKALKEGSNRCPWKNSQIRIKAKNLIKYCPYHNTFLPQISLKSIHNFLSSSKCSPQSDHLQW